MEVGHSYCCRHVEEAADEEVVCEAVNNEYGDHEHSFNGSYNCFRPYECLWRPDLTIAHFVKHWDNGSHYCSKHLKVFIMICEVSDKESDVNEEGHPSGKDLQKVSDY